jgi:peptidoglycan LD-endopeptidase LytH
MLSVVVVVLALGCRDRNIEAPEPPTVKTPFTAPAPVSDRVSNDIPFEDPGRLPPPARSERAYGEAAGVRARVPPVSRADAQEYGGRLTVPVAGIAAAALRDTYDEMRGAAPHRALDIAAKRGTPVVAVDDGRVRKLFTSDKGGLTIYQFDTEGKLCYYYAHLDNYAVGLSEGDLVHRGQVIGFVGTSGNAPENAPHLHFEVTRVGPQGSWYGGEPMNPYPMIVNPR